MSCDEDYNKAPIDVDFGLRVIVTSKEGTTSIRVQHVAEGGVKVFHEEIIQAGEIQRKRSFSNDWISETGRLKGENGASDLIDAIIERSVYKLLKLMRREKVMELPS